MLSSFKQMTIAPVIFICTAANNVPGSKSRLANSWRKHVRTSGVRLFGKDRCNERWTDWKIKGSIGRRMDPGRARHILEHKAWNWLGRTEPQSAQRPPGRHLALNYFFSKPTIILSVVSDWFAHIVFTNMTCHKIFSTITSGFGHTLPPVQTSFCEVDIAAPLMMSVSISLFVSHMVGCQDAWDEEQLIRRLKTLDVSKGSERKRTVRSYQTVLLVLKVLSPFSLSLLYWVLLFFLWKKGKFSAKVKHFPKRSN